MAKKFEHVVENGIRVVFKMDEVDTGILHIYARRLTTIDDALDVFKKVVMVVSCFRR